MYAIPSQTLEDVDIDLSIVTKLNITHISYYSLILEEHTIFYHLVKQNKLKLISEDLEAKMYHHICNILRKINLIAMKQAILQRKVIDQFTISYTGIVMNICH